MLDEESCRQALLAKLIEEAQEASHATVGDLPGELADVLEVPRALTVMTGMCWPQLLALADDKRSRRDGFGRRSQPRPAPPPHLLGRQMICEAHHETSTRAKIQAPLT